MKKIISLIIAILLCLSLCVLAVSCGEIDGKDGGNDGKNDGGQNSQTAEKPSLDGLDLSQYVRFGEYKGMTFSASDTEPRGVTVWNRVLEETEIIAFPAGWIEYYEEQARASYRHIAETTVSTYEEVLSTLGLTDEEIVSKARTDAKEDLVMAALIRKEGIVLTEENINGLYDEYVKRYAIIGYTESYIRQNLHEHILDAMLRDKVLEFLMINNNFTE